MLGILEKTPALIFLNKPCMSLAVNGGFCDAISYKTQPKDHISLFEP
jgi:hypothetical protein